MKRLPTLTKSQRRALLVLEWVLLIGIIGVAIWKSGKSQTPSDSPLKGDSFSSPLRGGRVGSVPMEEPFETFPFDPNTADSTTLLRLGLSPWQVRSIYRYRAKHGRYHKPEDFKRVPGMTNEQWERLGPNVRIDKKYQYIAPKQTPSDSPFLKGEDKEREDTIHKVSPLRGDLEGSEVARSVKLSAGQTIDINTADTTLLKMIPGIASKRAARIVAYRDKLGGFVAVEQAMEAIEMPDSVLNYMTVSQVPVAKINVNKLSVQQLMKHPYINFYQAKAIFEHRRNKGDLHRIEELSHLEGFRASDIERLQPYLDFWRIAQIAG